MSSGSPEIPPGAFDRSRFKEELHRLLLRYRTTLNQPQVASEQVFEELIDLYVLALMKCNELNEDQSAIDETVEQVLNETELGNRSVGRPLPDNFYKELQKSVEMRRENLRLIKGEGEKHTMTTELYDVDFREVGNEPVDVKELTFAQFGIDYQTPEDVGKAFRDEFGLSQFKNLTAGTTRAVYAEKTILPELQQFEKAISFILINTELAPERGDEEDPEALQKLLVAVAEVQKRSEDKRGFKKTKIVLYGEGVHRETFEKLRNTFPNLVGAIKLGREGKKEFPACLITLLSEVGVVVKSDEVDRARERLAMSELHKGLRQIASSPTGFNDVHGQEQVLEFVNKFRRRVGIRELSPEDEWFGRLLKKLRRNIRYGVDYLALDIGELKT